MSNPLVPITDDVLEYHVNVYKEGKQHLKWKARTKVWSLCGLGLTVIALFTFSFGILSLAACAGILASASHGAANMFEYDPEKQKAATKCLTE